MKTYLQAYFDELKCRVLAKSEITQIVPADCYRLALDIKTVTHKSVSETTIKRVFGFAASIHQPSIYTLNALAEYCGFDSWDNFYTHMEQDKLQTSQQKSWSQISLNATKISLFNIQSNKHKCGIPYHKTIDRESMVHFVNHLHSSNATVGILSGPVGYGKTIAVTRWVEQRISQNHSGDNNDIFLFTNSLSLLQGTAYGYHSNRWLAHLLGMESGELLDNFMDDHEDSAPGSFYLIIDELQSDLITDRQFYTVIHQFAEMVRHFARYKWFRIILVLRTTTLSKYEALFKDTAIDPLWFSSLSRDFESRYANMPAFSNTELYQLSLNFQVKAPIQPLLAPQHIVKNPLFLQYFYEHYGDGMDLSHISPFDEYLIVAQYIKKKIFNGINTIAKQALMEELSDFIDQGSSTLFINRRQAHNIIRQYRAAYNDLLYAGVVHEKGTGYGVRQQTNIEFQSVTLVGYFQALKLFNQQLTPIALINNLNQSASCVELKISRLKWLLLFYIEAGDITLLHHFEKITCIKEDPSQLIAFACDGLHKLGMDTTKTAADSRLQTTIDLSNSPFIAYVSGLPYFQTEYKTYIVKLLDFNLSAEQEIVLRSKLAVTALLEWQETVLLDQLGKLSALPADAYAGLLVNPFRTLSYLYRYFKDRAADQALLHELDKLASRFCHIGDWESNQTFDILVYLLIKVTGNRQIARNYSVIIHSRLKKMDPERTFEIDFTLLLYALYLLECRDERAAARCVDQLSPNIQGHPILRLLHTFYGIHLLKSRGESYKSLVPAAAAISEAHGLKLLEAYCSLLSLNGMPKNEQLRQISHLKFQLVAPGYAHAPLPKKYG